MIRDGQLEAFKVGGRYIIPRAAISKHHRRRATPGVFSRRNLLRAGASVVGVLALDSFYDAVKTITWEQPRSGAEARELFRSLFGATASPDPLQERGRRFEYALGRQAFRGGPEWYHPDNWAAGVSLAATLEAKALAPDQLQSKTGSPLQRIGDIIVAGGPNSTEETKIAWEFEGPTDQELTRRKESLLPLRWWGISDEKHPAVANAEPVGYVMQYLGPRADRLWPLVDAMNSQPIVATRSNETLAIDGRRLAVPHND